uniref:Uncharacterized protein n=1 Tax=Cacopsylla melanoneura TaxID=428564 RepID=A0A8D8XYG2_9HEMI
MDTYFILCPLIFLSDFTFLARIVFLFKNPWFLTWAGELYCQIITTNKKRYNYVNYVDMNVFINIIQIIIPSFYPILKYFSRGRFSKLDLSIRQNILCVLHLLFYVFY